MTKEIWYDIPKYEWIYQISNKERIRRINHKIKNNNKEVLKVFIDKQWYKRCVVKYKNKCINIKIHRTIAELFIPNIENKKCVNHIDGNKLNNNINNLEWCTIWENARHYTNLWFNKYCKPVLVYDKYWNFIKEFISINSCKKELWLTCPYHSLNRWILHHWYLIKYKHSL